MSGLHSPISIRTGVRNFTWGVIMRIAILAAASSIGIIGAQTAGAAGEAEKREQEVNWEAKHAGKKS